MNSKNAKLLLLGVMLFSIPLSINSQAPAGGSSVRQQDLQFSCPMHPEVKSKAAGACPKCGMTMKQESVARGSTASGESPSGANHFPNVELITQDGKTVHFYDDLIKGKVVAIELMYTHCKYNCPLETARLVQLQKLLGDRMGKDIFFYSITIEPQRDTPEVLKAYAEKFHVGPGWLFLTGKEANIKLISKKLGLDSLPNPDDPDGHTPSLLIGNEATGLWMRTSALDNIKFLALKIEHMSGYGAPPVVANHMGAGAGAVKLNIDKGQYLFATRCAACHTIGDGDKVGPDLLGVTNVRDRAWLGRIIAEPDRMIEEKDPVALALFQKYKEVRMPRLGLAALDITAIVGYLEAQTTRFESERAATQK